MVHAILFNNAILLLLLFEIQNLNIFLSIFIFFIKEKILFLFAVNALIFKLYIIKKMKKKNTIF